MEVTGASTSHVEILLVFARREASVQVIEARTAKNMRDAWVVKKKTLLPIQDSCSHSNNDSSTAVHPAATAAPAAVPALAEEKTAPRTVATLAAKALAMQAAVTLLAAATSALSMARAALQLQQQQFCQ